MEDKRWRPIVKLTIAKDEKFMGPGCRTLLQLIGRYGSVRLACEEMQLSYSKAWRILGTLEAEAGYPVIVRKQGGKRGGATTLTPEGSDLLNRYQAYEAECRAAVDAIFARHFKKESEGTP